MGKGLEISDQSKVALVSAFCLIALTVILKNVINIPAETLSNDIILYIIIYSGFGIFTPIQKAEKKRSKYDSPLFWSIVIVLITLAIIAVYWL